ncbi:MAG: O-acetyl-ADP-ribose deacetylase [Planctomycetes bacterium]|jgi:O-acetyl-ADP-ribose deacetylase (regulator of RNase III)|nr:O-acetyl-ADP-ribose deacetylase [Planctomycetota bacterium]
MATEIKIHHGDITKLTVDVIVNAANHTLLGGEGVDGAIHAAAGPELKEECRKLGGCATGTAQITKAYKLPAKFVVHTVGPVYGREDGEEDDLLADCYLNSLKKAEEAGARSIAFPNISTGLFRYPKDEAAELAITTVKKYLAAHPQTSLQEVVFVSYTEADFKIFQREFNRLMKKK